MLTQAALNELARTPRRAELRMLDISALRKLMKDQFNLIAPRVGCVKCEMIDLILDMEFGKPEVADATR